MEGWIKLHRCLIDSYVFSNPTTLKIWVWILIKASSKKRTISLKIGTGFQDIEINPGELIFGRFKAEEDLNIDGSTIYKHIKKLEESNNIELKSNNHFTIITICNWETYQENEIIKEQPENNQRTTEEQQSNNRVTTEEHKQESKEGKKVKKDKKEFIPPTCDEVKNYFKEKGYKETVAIRAYEGYSVAGWVDSKGNKVLNWKQKMVNVWFTDENKLMIQPEIQIRVNAR
jgi:hypothetical protein